MKYSKPNELRSIWSWIYWEYDEPAMCAIDPMWFKHCGSNYRRHFLRLFGFEFERVYWR